MGCALGGVAIFRSRANSGVPNEAASWIVGEHFSGDMLIVDRRGVRLPAYAVQLSVVDPIPREVDYASLVASNCTNE